MNPLILNSCSYAKHNIQIIRRSVFIQFSHLNKLMTRIICLN
jgi:hypothetical protein